MNATAESGRRGTTAATHLAIDLAKDVFELAFTDAYGRIVERKRLRRAAFAACLDNRPALRVVMEACSSAHFWAGCFAGVGHTVALLPAHHVRPYVRRNQTDRAVAAGLLEADRRADIRPVPVKTPEQQDTRGLHRIRKHHKANRTAASNSLRGLPHEFGITIPVGTEKVRPAVLSALEYGENELPMALRDAQSDALDQVTACQAAMDAIEKQLTDIARRDTRSQRIMAANGVGVLTATAASAGIGDFSRFPCGRHVANAIGLTPREHSSGNQRRLGRITERGDVYLRTLLIHGARSAPLTAHLRQKKGLPLDRTQQWALDLATRKGHNKAAVALANKTTRRLWAAQYHGTAFDPDQVSQRATG